MQKFGVEIDYSFQKINDIPNEVLAGRTKPWRTGQAVPPTKDLIHESFAVSNVDDYYGKEVYCQMHDGLVVKLADNAIAMAGFILKNTLSDNGGVTRGVFKIEDGYTHIIDVVEISNIIKTDDNGKIGAEADGVQLNPESYVSMNFWGYPAKEGCAPAYLDVLEQ